ncbi:MerR family transcriptional regulator [Pseudonocardia adelaidensis]|uniref:HTH merR-type domain-containing protein n=1 Tax=Pseudonocardia adelaidensis TaxID=648754 RepID=A0ABP9NE53_9PSEU
MGKRLISTGELARELGVARGTILVWISNGVITPEYTTPGGHHRWVLEDVRRQLRDARQRDE